MLAIPACSRETESERIIIFDLFKFQSKLQPFCPQCVFVCIWIPYIHQFIMPHLIKVTRVGPGYSSFSPLSIYFLIFPLYFSLSFIGFTYFLLLSIPSLSTRIVPLRFQAGGRRRRPNLGQFVVLICVICIF